MRASERGTDALAEQFGKLTSTPISTPISPSSHPETSSSESLSSQPRRRTVSASSSASPSSSQRRSAPASSEPCSAVTIRGRLVFVSSSTERPRGLQRRRSGASTAAHRHAQPVTPISAHQRDASTEVLPQAPSSATVPGSVASSGSERHRIDAGGVDGESRGSRRRVGGRGVVGLGRSLMVEPRSFRWRETRGSRGRLVTHRRGHQSGC